MATKKTQAYKNILDHFRFIFSHSVLPAKMTYGNLFILIFGSPIAVGLRDQDYKQPIMPNEDRLFYKGGERSAMATRKGIHISGNYAAPHILLALFIYYVLCTLKS